MTGNREAFSQGIARGLDQTEAYRQAGYSYENMLPATLWEEASRLAAIPEVSARIAELKQAVTDSLVAQTVWTKEKLVDKAEHSYNGAIEAKQYSAANGALKLIGEAAGLLEPQQVPSVQITKVTVVLSSNAPVVNGEVTPSATDEE